MKHFNGLLRTLMYKHKSTPLSEIKDSEGFYYPVKYMQQLHANMCVDASEAMLNHFSGKSIPSLLNNPRTAFSGKEPKELEDEKSGFFPEMKINISENEKLNNLKNALKTHGPFLMDMPTRFSGHTVLCIGCTNDQIIYHDPLEGGNRCISREAYIKANKNESSIGATYKKPDPCNIIFLDETKRNVEQSLAGLNKPTYVITNNEIRYYTEKESEPKKLTVDPNQCRMLIGSLELKENVQKQKEENDKHLLMEFEKYAKENNLPLEPIPMDVMKEYSGLSPNESENVQKRNSSPAP